MANKDSCPVCRTAQIVCGKWTLLVIRDLADGRSRFCELERSLAGHQPPHSFAAPSRARGGGDRQAPDLPRGPAAGRVRADREGPRAGSADRGHARLRARVARLRGRRPRRRRRARARAAPSPWPDRPRDASRRRDRRADRRRARSRRSSSAAATSRSSTAPTPSGERPDWAWASESAARDVAEGAPSRRSSPAGRAPAPRSPPTRSRGSGRRSAATPRPRRARGGGTTPTCSRSACD